jgi:repressor LexA
VNNIRNLREKRSITQKKLASELNIANSTLSQYEKGVRRIDIDLIPKICEILKCNADELLGTKNTRKGYEIPVLGTVAAGIPLEAIEDIIDWEEIDPSMLKDGSEFVALQIHGDSMLPRMANGDIVIVRIQDDCDTGDTAIVLVNGNDATCKKVKKTPKGIMLIPLNPSYEPMFYSNAEIKQLPVRIFGKVVELRAKF